MSLVNMQGKFMVKASGVGGGGGISAPSNVAISNKSSSGFTVTWNSVASAIGYKLDVATDSGFSSFVTGYNGKDVAGTSQAVTGLTQNTTYYVRVRAVAASSNSSSVSDTTEVLTLLNAGLLNGLQAFYKLDDTTDASGNGNTLTNNGSVTFSSGKIGNAAMFDGGTSQNLTTPVNGGGYTNGTSVSFWMKKTGNKDTCGLIQAVTGDQQGWTIISENNSGWFLLAGNGSWGLQTSPFLSSSDSNWHHIVITDDNTYIKIYLDGSIATNSSTVSYTVAPVKLGTFDHFSGNNPQNFDGQIDAVGIWNRALTSGEIAELYNSGSGLE